MSVKTAASIFRNMRYVKVALVIMALLIAAFSLLVSNQLTEDLTKEEHKRMEVWSEAMKSLIHADENTDLNLVLKVIDGNSTIPVIVLDHEGHVLAARNVDIPQDSIDHAIAVGNQKAPLMVKLHERAKLMERTGHYMKMFLDAGQAHSPSSQIYICYESSLMLRRLSLYPYVQLGVVGLFIVVAIIALLSSKRAEQNRVWVGLSRETAHQLGTPLSSLMAGAEMLKELYPEETLLLELDKDVQRLQLIAERFSKIGSAPNLESCSLSAVVERGVEYMRRRTPEKVSVHFHADSPHALVMLNPPLFEWVIENLCKNALDAMCGSGDLTIRVYARNGQAFVEISDTGKGIAKKNFKTVFKPGYTTKKRGWGLGLSLARRIIADYHKGKIFVKSSEPGKGSTFCIALRIVGNCSA